MTRTQSCIIALFVIAAVSAVSVHAQTSHPEDRYWTPVTALDDDIGFVDAIAHSGEELYIGGRFLRVDGKPIYNCARFDGQSWERVGGAVGNIMMGIVHQVLLHENGTYVAGMFDQVSGVWPANNVAHWDGINWDDMDGGTNRAVRSLVRGPDGDVYIGGEFTQAGGKDVGHIARWDGNQWHDLGGGMNQHVMAIAFFKDELYAGGRFSRAGGKRIAFLARWDGTEWHPVVPDIDGFVTALEVGSGSLFVGGGFTRIDGANRPGIAKWDKGSIWRGYGTGVSGPGTALVRTIAIYEGEVYIGGFFTHADGNPVNYIARWRNGTWESLGSGADYTVKNMMRIGEELYITGEFRNVGGKHSPFVARWHVPDVVIESFIGLRQGSTVSLQWSAIQNKNFGGFRVYREVVRSGNTEMISTEPLSQAARGFEDTSTRAGETYRYTVAAVREDGREILSDPVEVKVPATEVTLGQNAPNPFNPSTMIEYVLPSSGQVTLTIYDSRGRRVRELVNQVQSDGIKQVEWDGRDNAGQEVATGVYFYRLETAGETLSRKMTLVR